MRKMSTKKASKKIVILGIILLVLAGIIVVSLKGFRVSLLFGKHETVELKVGKEVDIEVAKEICEEVFGNKKYVLKELEVFGDSIQINTDSITDEEKTNLINQINEKFGTDKTVDDLNISSVSNRRIRDVVKPYGMPIVCSFAIVFIYMAIRFRKINAVQMILHFLLKFILTEAILLSAIAIIRLPVTDLVIYGLVIVAVGELVYDLAKGEQRLSYVKED